MVRIAKTSPRASGPHGLHTDAGASHFYVHAPRSLSFPHSLSSRSDMPKHTFISRGLAVAVAAGLLCGVGAARAAVDTDADWQARKSASGVIFSESFEYNTKADLVNAALGVTDNPPANGVDVESAIKLAGSHSLKLITNGEAGANGGSWAQNYNGRDGTQF